MFDISLAVVLTTSFLSGLYGITYWVSSKLLSAPTKMRSFYVNRDTQKKLFELVRGDWATALTIVDLVRQQHPNQDEQWIWNRTIWYLERMSR